MDSGLHRERRLDLLGGHRQRIEALADRVGDGVENGRGDRDADQLGDAFRHVGRPERREHVDLELPDRKVGGARHAIAIEVPGAVAGAVLVERQIFVKRVADAHREAAFRLAGDLLRHERAPAFEHGHGIEDGTAPVALSISTATTLPLADV